MLWLGVWREVFDGHDDLAGRDEPIQIVDDVVLDVLGIVVVEVAVVERVLRGNAVDGGLPTVGIVEVDEADRLPGRGEVDRELRAARDLARLLHSLGRKEEAREPLARRLEDFQEGFALPGTMVVASDSHSNIYGGVAALGTPVVRTDAAALWAIGTVWWQIPRTIKVNLNGALQPGVTGKDVIITLCGMYNQGEVLNAVIEFGGDGVADYCARRFWPAAWDSEHNLEIHEKPAANSIALASVTSATAARTPSCS